MQSRQFLIASILGAFITVNSPAIAYAQFGFGFGGWGDNFGTWIQFWPRYHCCRRSSPPKAVPQSSGYVAGNVKVVLICPNAQPAIVCPLFSEPLNHFTVSAQPYESKQWISSQADVQGNYRLSLPPGGYNLTLHHPTIPEADNILRQIIIQPGQVNQQSFIITLPSRTPTN